MLLKNVFFSAYIIVTLVVCRLVLDALLVMESLANKLVLIRILRAVMFNEAHLMEVSMHSQNYGLLLQILCYI